MSAALQCSDHEVVIHWRLITCNDFPWVRSSSVFLKNANSVFQVAVRRHSGSTTIRVIKHNERPGNAEVKVTVNNMEPFVVNMKNWTNFCDIPDVPLFYPELEDTILEVFISCEIKWHGFATDLKKDQLPAPGNLYGYVKNFLMKEELSDAVLIIDDEIIPVHKLILGAQSPVFFKMFAEDKCNRIHIQGVSFEIMQKILSYLYTGEMMEENIDTLIQIMSVAGNNQIFRLKQLCETKLCHSLTINNVLSILESASLLNATELQERAIELMICNRKKIIEMDDFKVLFAAKPEIFLNFVTRIAKY